MILDTPNKMGTTRRQSLEATRKQLVGKKSPEELQALFSELDPVELVQGTQHLVHSFNELSVRRPHGMSGPLPIAFSEIEAYCRLTDQQLSAWEVETLSAMDRVFLDRCYEIARRES